MNKEIDINFKINDKRMSGLATPLAIAACMDNYNIVELLLKQPKIDINFKVIHYFWNGGFQAENALSYAIEQNNFKIVKLLLSNENIDVNIMYEFKQIYESEICNGNSFPLYDAMLSYNKDIVELLLSQADIDINKIYKNKVYDETTLQLKYAEELAVFYKCLRREYTDMIKIMLLNPLIDVNIQALIEEKDSITKESPIFLAVLVSSIEIVSLLLKNPKIDVNSQRTFEKTNTKYKMITPLLYSAIMNDNLEIIKLLLNHPDIDVNSPEKKYDDDKYTKKSPLVYAIENSKPEIVKLLLSHPKIDVNMKYIYDHPNNKYLEFSPLYLAVESQNDEIVKLLLEHKNIDINDINIKKLKSSKISQRTV